MVDSEDLDALLDDAYASQGNTGGIGAPTQDSTQGFAELDSLIDNALYGEEPQGYGRATVELQEDSPQESTGVSAADFYASRKPKEPEEDDSWEITKGFESGLEQTQALGGGLVAMAGDIIDSEALQKAGLDIYQKHQAKAQEVAPRVQRVEDIHGAEDFVDWSMGTLGQLAPTIATMVAGGGVGGLIAKGVVKKNLKKYATEKGMDALTERGKRRFYQRAAAKMTKDATARGQMIGAGVGSIGMETGEIYGDVAAEGYEGAKAIALSIAGGTLAGALDALPVVSVAKRFGLINGLSQEMRKAAAKHGLTRRVTQAAGETAAFESATEALQTVIEEGTKSFITGHDLPEDMRSRLINAAAAGALGGTAMGGVGGIPKQTPQIQEPISISPDENIYGETQDPTLPIAEQAEDFAPDSGEVDPELMEEMQEQYALDELQQEELAAYEAKPEREESAKVRALAEENILRGKEFAREPTAREELQARPAEAQPKAREQIERIQREAEALAPGETALQSQMQKAIADLEKKLATAEPVKTAEPAIEEKPLAPKTKPEKETERPQAKAVPAKPAAEKVEEPPKREKEKVKPGSEKVGAIDTTEEFDAHLDKLSQREAEAEKKEFEKQAATEESLGMLKGWANKKYVEDAGLKGDGAHAERERLDPIIRAAWEKLHPKTQGKPEAAPKEIKAEALPISEQRAKESKTLEAYKGWARAFYAKEKRPSDAELEATYNRVNEIPALLKDQAGLPTKQAPEAGEVPALLKDQANGGRVAPEVAKDVTEAVKAVEPKYSKVYKAGAVTPEKKLTSKDKRKLNKLKFRVKDGDQTTEIQGRDIDEYAVELKERVETLNAVIKCMRG
jgi:hypothetical protein